MTTFGKLVRARVAVPAIAALVAIAGCMDGRSPDSLRTVTGPATAAKIATTQETLREPTTDDLAKVAVYQVAPNPTTLWIKQWIGPSGGTVDYMGFRIVVPPNAVDRVVKFTIRLPANKKAQEHVLVEFGPHNYAFRVPVRIELPYRNTSAEGDPAGVLWYDERATAWVQMPGSGVTADGERVYIYTDHFSTYGTKEPTTTQEQPVPVTSGG